MATVVQELKKLASVDLFKEIKNEDLFVGRSFYLDFDRLKLMSNDFSQWLYEDMGLTEAARQLNRIDIYTVTLDDVREQIIRIGERALI